MNAYEIKTGMSRAKLSHLMDAETWMDARSAVEMGFADEIMQRASAEDIDPPRVSMVFSRAAVTNSLMDKLAAKCRISPKPDAQKETENELKTRADSLMERLNLMKTWR